MIQIICAKNEIDMSRKAANIISAQIIMKSDSVLGLATGTTPIGTYQQLIEWYKKGDLDFSSIISINLDEYMGVEKTNPQSYYYFMWEKFFKHINIQEKQIFLPNGMAENQKQECERYENIIEKSGGIDLQLLGIGHNGHIGFNEPGESFQTKTHVVKLMESTIQANSRLFEKDEQVPSYAYTLGIKRIMEAKRILCIANGKEKAEIIQKAFFGPVTSQVPASILQLHSNVILIGDFDVLSKCPLEGK